MKRHNLQGQVVGLETEKIHLENEIKQLKLERDTAIFVARDRLEEIDRLKRQNEILELKYLKENHKVEKLNDIIRKSRGVREI